jgi:hypothetical protein
MPAAGEADDAVLPGLCAMQHAAFSLALFLWDILAASGAAIYGIEAKINTATHPIHNPTRLARLGDLVEHRSPGPQASLFLK